jgi:hypothetical protein
MTVDFPVPLLRLHESVVFSSTSPQGAHNLGLGSLPVSVDLSDTLSPKLNIPIFVYYCTFKIILYFGIITLFGSLSLEGLFN